MGRNLKREIGSQIRDQIRTLGITGAGNVSVVTSPYVGGNVQRGLSIVEEEEKYERGTNLSEAIGYPFLIVWVRGTTTTGNSLDWSDWRRLVRERFHNKKLTGVSDVYVCKVGYATLYLPKSLRKNYEASAVRVTAWAEEVRS